MPAWVSVVFLIGIGTAFAGYHWLPLAMGMLGRAAPTARNFQGLFLPVGGGIGYLVPLLAAVGLGIGLRVLTVELGASFLFALAALGFLGFFDDACGDHVYRGWSGHWRAWRQDRILTTGLFKAGGGGFVALLVSLALTHPWTGGGSWPGGVVNGLSWVTGALFLALATNALNLLDLRPGRAIKAYYLGILPPLLLLFAGLFAEAPGMPPATSRPQVAAILLWSATSLLAYLPRELRAEVMIGDTGANPLGLLFGAAWLVLLPFWGQATGVLLLVWFQRYAGSVSLTETITRHPWLDRLDRWGRPDG